MYEDQTYDIILERMMNRVSDKIDRHPLFMICIVQPPLNFRFYTLSWNI